MMLKKIISLFVIAFTLIPAVRASVLGDVNIGTTLELGDFYSNNNFVPYTGLCCRVYIWYPNGTLAVDGENATNSSLGVGFHNFSYTPTVIGFHSAILSCDIGVCANDPGNESRSFNVLDNANPPSFSDLNPSGSQTINYVSNDEIKTQNFTFNATITDSETSVDTVFFVFNGKNKTTAKSGNIYMAEEINLTEGSYEFKWFANDTLGNGAYSQAFTLTLQISSSSLPPPPPPPVKNIEVNITPKKVEGELITTTFSVIVKNLGDEIDFKIQTSDLFDFLAIDNKLYQSPVEFHLDKNEEKTIQVTLTPIGQQDIIGSLDFYEESGRFLGKVEVELKAKIKSPAAEFFQEILTGRLTLRPITDSMFGKIGFVPKMGIFFLISGIMLLINFSKPKQRRFGFVSISVLLVIIFLAVTLLIPTTL
jgi:hypothetical protein